MAKAGSRIFWSVVLVLAGLFILGYSWEWYDNYKFNHLSQAEHLKAAQDLCRSKQFPAFCVSDYASDAVRHLEKIPSTSPEYSEAQGLLTTIHEQEQRDRQEQARAAPAQKAESATGDGGTFICSTGHSTSCGNNWSGDCVAKPIISYNNSQTWVQDDGRCAAKEQKKRDQDAEVYSYWPTKLRVDTDIDSSWLNNEERTCQTYPDDKGRVAVVACNATGSHRDHNIPVTFWGGVDRNIVSDWKCRREGEDFVCRALD
jgi:hypothetical protein